MPTLQATIWSGEAGREPPGALPWHRDCADASPPPDEMRRGLKGMYGVCDEHGPRHQFLVATDHAAELCDNTVALVADVAQCLATYAMILPREGWEGQHHTKTPAAPLIAHQVTPGGSEIVSLVRSKEQDLRH